MRHRTRFFWMIPLLTLLLSALWTGPARAEPRAAPQFVNAYDLIEAVNSLRAQNGLPGYSINSTLMNVAQAHSDYQAAIGAVTHYGAGGTRPFQRALEAGYPVAGDLSLGGFYSENIMGGNGLTAQSVVDAWTGDAPHLGTMLSASLREVGAGVACNGSFCYFTLDAAQPSGSPVSYTPAAGVSAGATLSGAGATGIVVLQNTPKSDGSVIHVVQPGEALWSLAIAYGTTSANLKAINNLTSDLIFPGDTLIIFLPRATPTAAPTETGTPVPSATPFVFRTVTSSPEPTATPVPAAPVSGGSGAIVVGIIIVAALAAAGVVTAASSVRKRVK
jgi:LysM repeat protein